MGIELDPHRKVSFVSMQIRETNKQPTWVSVHSPNRVLEFPVGCAQGGPGRQPSLDRMDIVHSGYNIQALLSSKNATLVRVCIQGPLRRTKNRFIQDILREPPHGHAIHHVLDIGGGQGGDCHHWVQTPGIDRVDVVDVDCNALEEFGRRLVTSYKASVTNGGPWVRPARCLSGGRPVTFPEAVASRCITATPVRWRPV